MINTDIFQLFDRVRNRDPQFFMNKVKVIEGDVCELSLGKIF